MNAGSTLIEWRPPRKVNAGFSEHSKGRGPEGMRGHFGRERRKLRRKNYQMGEYWCCSVKCMSKADSTGGSHLYASGSLGGGWERAGVLGTLAHTEPEEQINQWAWDMRR